MKIDYGTQFSLLGFIDPRILLRLIRHLPGVSPRRLARLFGVLGAGVSMLPLAGLQQLKHSQRIARTDVGEPPVFIVGHWRSGTTHLHNILSADPQFSCVSMFQCVAPSCSLATHRWLAPLLDRVLPSKRPMDNMEWRMDSPQEEEIALAKLTPYSWYLQFLFPQQALTMFERYVLLHAAPDSARQEVKDQLMQVLKVATLHANGKRLLLKNPVHTARIPMLLELFPDARFIYLHRSPLEVYPSTKNLHRKILELTSLQPWDDALIERNVLDVYPRLLDQYQRDRALIGGNRLIEVAYDDLDREPMTVVSDIYGQLELSGHDTAKPGIEKYLASLASYKKNRFSRLSDWEEEKLRARWKQGFTTGGYANPA